MGFNITWIYSCKFRSKLEYRLDLSSLETPSYLENIFCDDIKRRSVKLQLFLKVIFVDIIVDLNDVRMIFALIIIENTYFINLISELQTFYGTEKSPYLTECFHELSKKIGAKYSSTCRDKFKQSLESFAGKLLDLKWVMVE